MRPYWTACGKALAQFNSYVVNDPRVDVTVVPVFDGISQIKWKSGFPVGKEAQANSTSSNGGANGTNGTNHANGNGHTNGSAYA